MRRVGSLLLLLLLLPLLLFRVVDALCFLWLFVADERRDYVGAP